MQAGKFSKINNCVDWIKCAGRKISYICQMCSLENLHILLVLLDEIAKQGKKFAVFMKDPNESLFQVLMIQKLTL